ncbi:MULTISPECIES: Gfo/Idh/MocA family oxidoreductase [unclassified Spirosoma]|uniref:Gfo/Idh/MocA family protein n=1 Tax=unclassified Spirosoma TaxID=2621999 RepID=UPI000960CE7C|nr:MULTISPECIES: Gfo/Idh/MocA family oxidoreductase [unclassified Spirosoma]MBN8826654.1 Gfo/Idh/MocA family oxidoreductase [Spirosoma sp.]OJW74490.1 MAG: dehydrogenase [Spirosoma sp. 48-14]
MKNKISDLSLESRRSFVKKTVIGTAALSVGGVLPQFTPKSYGRILGANEKVRVGVMGVNSRGLALAGNYALQPNCEVVTICDVDSRAAETCIKTVEGIQKTKPKNQPDFRKALDDKDMDALVIAAPDHWHAPAAILASKAGKHVYLEKPCSHNPYEGELLVAVAAKYKNIVQMGNQRRSWPNVRQAMEELKNGAIGRPYFAKGWYTNNRATIGIGKPAPVPGWLNYDLWQGPAPRRTYKDNVIHYNWHWFWHWGTGEALNNGTHMLDLMRWGLDVEYPNKVTSLGGRYRYQDDWQTPDTQVINLTFPNNTAMSWEGRSCNGRTVEGSDVGVTFYGEKGSLEYGGGNAYKIFDLDNKLVKDIKNDLPIDPRNKMNPSQALDATHIQNFIEAIRTGTPLTSGILSGHQSTLLCQLGNIALRSGDALAIDPTNGHILTNKNALKFWKRDYETGWEPTL